jgi:uncharacterized protein YndB with AHSA1/START domain
MPEILDRIGVNAPIGKVYEMLTTPEGISSWWTRKVAGAARVGSELEMRFKGDTLTMKFSIEELRADTLVKWRVLEGPKEWIGSTIQFALSANGDETVVLFSHLGWKEIVEYMHHCSTKWGYYMFSLKNLLENGKRTPHPDEQPASKWG